MYDNAYKTGALVTVGKGVRSLAIDPDPDQETEPETDPDTDLDVPEIENFSDENSTDDKNSDEDDQNQDLSENDQVTIQQMLANL